MPSVPFHRPWPAFAAAALFAACAASPSESERSVGWLVAHGRYPEAVRIAAERAAARPDDAEAAREWRTASVAFLLEQGRRLSFEGADAEALAKFREAATLGPDEPRVQAWIDATLDELADRWTEQGTAHHAADELPEASACYEKALEYRPDHTTARQGLGRLLVQQNYRMGMSSAYYDEALAALEELLLDQAAHDLSATLKYEEGNERAVRRLDQTDTLRADVRVALATQLEEAGRFAAARNEFRFATLFDPAHAEALAGLERTAVEERAADLRRESERRILRGEFDLAQAALDEGAALTRRQHEEFDSLREALIDARFQVRYDAARRLESDYRYEEAIAAYAALAEDHPQRYFLDAIARRDSLDEQVRRAKDLYARALTTEDPAARLSLLRQVELLWPEHLDVRERIVALEAELTDETGGASDEPTPPRR